MPPPNQPKKTGPEPPAPQGRWRSIIWYVLLGLLVLWMWQDAFQQVTVKTIPYSEFKEYVARKEVTEASLRQNEIRGTIVPKAAKTQKGGKEQKPPARAEKP